MSYYNTGYSGFPGSPAGNGGGGGGGYGGMQMGFGGGYGGGGGGGGGGGRGYGGRGRGRRDDGGGRGRGRGYGQGGDSRSRAPPPESAGTRFKKMVIKFADDEDFDALEDPPRLAKVLRKGWKEGSPGILEGFRVAVTQEPFKHPHFVSLLLHLSYRIPTEENGGDDGGDAERDRDEAQVGEKRKAEAGDVGDAEFAREVVADLGTAFKLWIEGRDWLNMRLCLQFFSLLAPAGLVTPESLLEVYKALMSVLNEVGGGGDRSERAIRAVGEGLMRSAHVLHSAFPEDVDSLIGSIESFVYGRRADWTLSNPLNPILPQGEEPALQPDALADLLSAIHDLRAVKEYSPPDLLPRPWESIVLPDGVVTFDPYALTAVGMPPEMYEIDEETSGSGEGQISSLHLFPSDIVLPATTVDGWTLQSLILDVLYIFEVNRKESARLLLALPRFVQPGTFKTTNANPEPDSGKAASTISLESTLISTILRTLCTLPAPPQAPVYYYSLITELCKLSPNTVAPPVGKAVRKIFSLHGSEGLDVEISKRVSDWFAVHLSNFGFQWMWKEWLPELELLPAHPRRAFMRRVVELEVRLAYHDRILQTLPDPMLPPEARVISADAPDPVWVYEQQEHPLHAEAVDLLKLLRQKLPANDIISHIETLPNAKSGPDESISPSVLVMVFETLLHLGSRSFSHFLNATERFLDVLRHFTPDAASRRILLEGVSSYWRKSSQMRRVTVDKWLQYNVLEPIDVVDHVFSDDAAGGGSVGDDGDGWTDGDKWEMLRMTLDKVVGKVVSTRRRLRAVDKADEVARARRAAEKLQRGEGVELEDDVEDDTTVDRSKEARDAQASLDIFTTKLEKIFTTVTKRFVADLLPWCFDSAAGSSGSGLKAVLTLLDSGEEGYWPTRVRFGWWREFVRLYRPHLEELAKPINQGVFASVPEREDESVEARAERLVSGIWKTATSTD